MKILISTIMRNAEDGMDKWYEQLNDLVKKCKQTWSVPDVSFSLSVYENNSEDKTVEKLKSYDFSQFEQNKINIKISYNLPADTEEQIIELSLDVGESGTSGPTY